MQGLYHSFVSLQLDLRNVFNCQQ